jgi:osmotically-inducible protein OsmY
MNMKVAGTFFVAFVACVSTLSSPLLGQDRDTVLEKAVWAALEKEKLNKEVVEVVASEGVVVLRGQPRHVYAKMKAIEVALGVAGVEEIESDLEVAGPESLKEFTQELVKSVLNYPQYTVFDDITFQIVDEGVVVLGGYVTIGIKKDEIVERVSKVRGAREIKSTIEVLPTSPGDDNLRRSIYRRIYGDSNFEHYAQMTNPPIHIIVMRSRVMLTGAVASRLESRQAESIARSTFGVIQFENRLSVNP